METVEQLSVSTLPSASAEITLAPGIVTSGLMRPSSVFPREENDAIAPADAPWAVAPTATTFLAVAGLPTVFSPGPELPAAKSSRKSGCSHMKASASAEPSE